MQNGMPVYVVILTVLALTAVIAIGLVVFYKIYSKMIYIIRKKSEQDSSSEVGKAVERAAVSEKVSAILDDARTEASKIVREANIQARKILAEASEISTESKISLEENLEKVTDDLQKQAITEIDDFKKLLAHEVGSSHDIVEEKVGKRLDEIEAQLEVYKKDRMKEVDDSVFEVLANVTKSVLGKSMSMEQHQDLVMKTLSEFQEKGGFGNVSASRPSEDN